MEIVLWSIFAVLCVIAYFSYRICANQAIAEPAKSRQLRDISSKLDRLIREVKRS